MADLLLTLAPSLGYGYLRLVDLTCRRTVAGIKDAKTLMDSGKGAIWVCWHNRLMAGLPLHRDRNFGVMISKSRDGELISKVAGRLGFKPIRGSTSRGSSTALKGMLRHLKGGDHVVFTPDGPRGPRYQIQDGAVYAAMKAGVPVVPVGFGASPKVVFNSWDKFQLPLPFCKLSVVYGEPMTFPENSDISENREKLRESLMRVTLEADRLLGVTSP